MNKRNISLILAAICVILVIVFMAMDDKNLSIKSDKVTMLYNYLGEVDEYHCGGPKTYVNKEITANDLTNDDLMCMAYFNIDKNNIETKITKEVESNNNEVKICKVGDNVTLATSNEEETECEYTTFTKDELNTAYKKIYGSDIKDYDKFNLNDTNVCFLEGERYYCGTSETFNYSFTPSAEIYRIITSAKETLNGDIIINDSFLRISENKCYSSTEDTEITECTKELENIHDEIDIEFVKKYGTEYKHTFKKASSNNYYWYKSKLK